MVKPLEIVTSEELFKRGEFSKHEFEHPHFKGKVIMRFDSYINAAKFGLALYQDYLIPKYGVEDGKKFPIAKSGPLRDFMDELDEITGIKKPSPENETWLVIPSDRFEEIRQYIESKK